MARKSKRTIENSIKPAAQDKIYNAAVYTRLSVEDNLYKRGSESLDNQREMIYEYLQTKPNIKIYDVYCDNGETGTNFEREDFQRMMYDVYNGKVNCIIVKDLSRFGREYIEAGDYLERIFPLIGVRFIAINDGYDNQVNPFDITVPIKNVINTLYARDISKKSSAALRIKQANGEFIGSFAPYGYIRSPENKHKLIIDKEAAEVVKQIFVWKADGMSYAAISRRLYDMKIATPNRHKYDMGVLKSEVHRDNNFWRPETVKSILLNEVYTGSMVQGRMKSHFYDGSKVEHIDKRDWIVVHNTHEPIVSKELFDNVQQQCIAVNRAHQSNMGKYKALGNQENIFKKKIRCGDCGKRLSRYKKVNGTKVTYFYICKQHSQYPQSCRFISVSEDDLKDIVMSSVKVQLSYLADLKMVLSDVKKSTTVKQKKYFITKEISKAVSEISYIKSARIRAASDYARGILPEDEYNEVNAGLNSKLENAIGRYKAADNSREKFERIFNAERWISTAMHYSGKEDLSQDMVDTLIDSITVYPDKSVKTKWKFDDKLDMLRISGGEWLEE